MNDLTSHLLLYGNLAQGGTILASMAEIYAVAEGVKRDLK